MVEAAGVVPVRRGRRPMPTCLTTVDERQIERRESWWRRRESNCEDTPPVNI